MTWFFHRIHLPLWSIFFKLRQFSNDAHTYQQLKYRQLQFSTEERYFESYKNFATFLAKTGLFDWSVVNISLQLSLFRMIFTLAIATCTVVKTHEARPFRLQKKNYKSFESFKMTENIGNFGSPYLSPLATCQHSLCSVPQRLAVPFKPESISFFPAAKSSWQGAKVGHAKTHVFVATLSCNISAL